MLRKNPNLLLIEIILATTTRAIIITTIIYAQEYMSHFLSVDHPVIIRIKYGSLRLEAEIMKF